MPGCLRFADFEVQPSGSGIGVTLDPDRLRHYARSQEEHRALSCHDDVRPPCGIDPAEFERLKAEDKSRAQELQRSGKWRHLWHITGQYSNMSVFDVANHDELHTVLSTLALFPLMEIAVMPRAWHHSALEKT